ncbi:MAG: metallophosphoesterase [Bacteroidota bacterium]
MYNFTDNPEIRKEKRLIWAATRSVLENIGFFSNKNGKKSRSHWKLFVRLLTLFTYLLKLTGYYKKGYGNSKTIKITQLSLVYAKLPQAFDGFRIMHLSDLHINSIPGFASIIISKIKKLDFDICLLTGDYRKDNSGSIVNILKPFKILSKYIQAPYGTFAVLGNHDTYLMAQYEKQSGLELLVNESVEIIKDNEKILITGTDDPFSYYTEQALLCLETKAYDFKIALVHTSELAKQASANKYDLYLCGHTHGGQICLKEGFPLISHQFEGKNFNHGEWKIGKMKGYTSRGVGVSGIPLRFNCPPEIVLITLKKE